MSGGDGCGCLLWIAILIVVPTIAYYWLTSPVDPCDYRDSKNAEKQQIYREQCASFFNKDYDPDGDGSWGTKPTPDPQEEARKAEQEAERREQWRRQAEENGRKMAEEKAQQRAEWEAKATP